MLFPLRRRKGLSLEDLKDMTLALVGLALLLGVGVLITGSFESNAQGSRTANGTSTVSSVINNSTAGILNLSQRLPLIGTIAGFVVLLAYVIGLLVKTTREEG